jgi:DNA-binding MarR family transcriptional regulator
MGPLPDLIGYMVRRAQVTAFQDFNRSFAGTDIRPADYGALIIIAHNPDLTQSAVGEALGIKRSNLVPLVERLEKRGLIQRKPAAADRRAYALTLTDEGTSVLKSLDAKRARHEARLRNQVGDERVADLIDMLHRLAALPND